ncbi:MAG: hypothetical protein M3463_17300 [Verrucomicrobiota bacterium]|nr:hypothetical protein [Verrucomicrobiota bacterium]
MKSAEEIATLLAVRRRALLIGGMAMILHGLNRTTRDVDLWLDPGMGPEEWAENVAQFLRDNPELRLTRIAVETNVTSAEIAGVIAEDRVVRLHGADRPIDLFRIPHQLEEIDFEAAWTRSLPLETGKLRLIEEIDLIVSKQFTGRAHDESDIRFLEEKIEESGRQKLRHCSEEEARRLFERFTTPMLASFAAREAEQPKVRNLGLAVLQELANEGDPFAEELLEGIEQE